MQVTLPYGRGALELRLPPGCAVEQIEPPSLPALADPVRALRTALDEPVSGPPLRELVGPGCRVAVVVADWTRACDYPRLLPTLLDELNNRGVPDDAVTLLVAYGTHVPQPDDATRSLYGQAVCRRLRIVHHDCDAPGLVEVGLTPAGTRVCLNPQYLAADLAVTLGAVGFHYFAGFGGGPKLVFPGLAARDGIMANHARYVAQMLDAPQRLKGLITGNACAEDVRDAVRLASPAFSIQCLFNAQRALAAIVAGRWDSSHDAACRRLHDTAMIDVSRCYDLVVASCGAWPLDVNLIQAHKSIDNACELLRDGGALLIAAECSAGVGSDTFLAWFDLDEDAFRHALRDRFELHGGTAFAMRRKASRFHIYMKSALPSDVVRHIGATPIADLQAGLDELLAVVHDPAVALLPNAAETVARALPPG